MIKVKDVLNKLKESKYLVECITLNSYYVTDVEISLNKILLNFYEKDDNISEIERYENFLKIINNPKYINHNIYINNIHENESYDIQSGAVNSIFIESGFFRSLDFKV